MTKGDHWEQLSQLWTGTLLGNPADAPTLLAAIPPDVLAPGLAREVAETIGDRIARGATWDAADVLFTDYPEAAALLMGWMQQAVEVAPSQLSLQHALQGTIQHRHWQRVLHTAGDLLMAGDDPGSYLAAEVLTAQAPLDPGPVTQAVAVADVDAWLAELGQPKHRRLWDTPFPALTAFGRLQPGQLVVIGARTGVGKTSLGLHCAWHLALSHNQRVLYASYEMGREDLVSQVAAQWTRAVSPYQALQGDPREVQALREAVQSIKDWPILWWDSGRPTLADLGAQMARSTREPEGLGAVVVDYAQIMPRPGRTGKTEELGDIINGLKRLARQFGVTVIAAAQFNRLVEGREDKRPRLSDFRDTGDIEQAADKVWALQRLDASRTRCWVIKNRRGPPGAMDLDWDGPHLVFSQAARQPTAQDLKEDGR